ncbi:MAG TPA: gliding motility lipoprotein GldH [Chitinophagaceae bacterium]|nr:gliding motility lipoprotein GldH [Chitinophagaceae bacterium]
MSQLDILHLNRFAFYCLLITACLYSCTTIDLYEKDVSIPGHQWSSSFKPSFTFTIKDTTKPYQFFLVLRHTEKYKYTNIYINLYVKAPVSDSVQKIQRSLTLATTDGWLGKGMDDIYEHRIALGDAQTLKAGTYQFTLEQIMRDDPLENILNVGLRIEKKE